MYSTRTLPFLSYLAWLRFIYFNNHMVIFSTTIYLHIDTHSIIVEPHDPTHTWTFDTCSHSYSTYLVLVHSLMSRHLLCFFVCCLFGQSNSHMEWMNVPTLLMYWKQDLFGSLLYCCWISWFFPPGHCSFIFKNPKKINICTNILVSIKIYFCNMNWGLLKL